jgi:hypothetical protein
VRCGAGLASLELASANTTNSLTFFVRSDAGLGVQCSS